MKITGPTLRILERLRLGPATNRELLPLAGVRYAARVHELRQALPWLTGETVLSEVHPPSRTCLYWLEVLERPANPRLAPMPAVPAAPHKKVAHAATTPPTPGDPVPRRARRSTERGVNR